MDTNIIIVTHAQLAQGLRSAAEMILGKQERFSAIAFDPGDDILVLSQLLEKHAADAASDFTIIFADIYGASPANAASLAIAHIENALILTGVNLGMIIEALVVRTQMQNFGEYVQHILATGKEDMCLISKKSILERAGEICDNAHSL